MLFRELVKPGERHRLVPVKESTRYIYLEIK